MASTATLRGRGILVTRPVAQAGALALAITARGGNAVLFPTLEIRPIALSEQSRQCLAQLAGYDYAIFISANAVTHGLDQVDPWPAQVPALAVGSATARALAERGVPRIVTPTDGADSDALLRTPLLQAARGRRILIFRGAGGREQLARTLRQRGARVDYVETYERTPPMTDPAPVARMCENGQLHGVCVNSAEGMENLFALMGEEGSQCLRQLPMFVLHARIADRARERGVRQVIVTAPGDDALLAALEARLGPDSLTHDQ